MPNSYLEIKEINIRKYLPYLNAILVLYVFINDLFLNIIGLLKAEKFIFYFLGMVIIMAVSPMAWQNSGNRRIWASRALVLAAFTYISTVSLSPTVYFLYYIQIMSIALWYRNRQEFMLGTIVLTLTSIVFCLLNPFLKQDVTRWGLFVVIINFVSAYIQYYHNENQKRLRQLSKIFKIMLNTTNTGIQFIDAQGRTRILNPAAEVIYGRTEDETQGRYDWDLYYQGNKFDKDGNYTSLITESLETGKVNKDVERTFIDEHGREKTYLIETFRVYDDTENNLMGAMGIYRNITQQKEMERQLLDAHYEMANMAVTDELTKLYNVRYFRQRLTTEVAKAYNSSLSLLIIDIDYFKIYNDLFGHLEGDNVLRTIGKILKNSFRSTDIVARYGGEEFTVILPGMNKENAKEIAERIRMKIKETKIFGEEKLPDGKLTVTIGVATVPDDAQTAEELVQIADNALYRGKYATRDVVVTFGESA